MFFGMTQKSFSPWISKFVLGEDSYLLDKHCFTCGKVWREYANDEYCFDRPLDALLDGSKASSWPDIIGNGHEPYFCIVSQRVLEVWESENIGTFPAFPVRILPPFPKTLITEPPIYYRLDYKRMEGAELDLEASGYINAKVCPMCGNFSYDLTQSDRMRNYKIIPHQLKIETWNGANVFRSKNPEGRMFCTEKVVDCAAKYKLTNFSFVPCEIGDGIGFKGVDYSTKNWRQKMQKQVEEYRRNFRPIDPETNQFIQ
jgi:hypothetical protein